MNWSLVRCSSLSCKFLQGTHVYMLRSLRRLNDIMLNRCSCEGPEEHLIRQQKEPRRAQKSFQESWSENRFLTVFWHTFDWPYPKWPTMHPYNTCAHTDSASWSLPVAVIRIKCNKGQLASSFWKSIFVRECASPPQRSQGSWYIM